MTLNDILALKYRTGARGEDGYVDCWGLVRIARRELYGKDDLPLLRDVRHAIKGSMQQAYVGLTEQRDESPKQGGAVLAVLRGGVFVHVALALGDNQVLEIKRNGMTPRVITWEKFKAEYPAPVWEVKTYD